MVQQFGLADASSMRVDGNFVGRSGVFYCSSVTGNMFTPHDVCFGVARYNPARSPGMAANAVALLGNPHLVGPSQRIVLFFHSDKIKGSIFPFPVSGQPQEHVAKAQWQEDLARVLAKRGVPFQTHSPLGVPAPSKVPLPSRE